MTLLVERTNRGRERFKMALGYAWGRQDMGDDATRAGTLEWYFATYAADQADAYDREQTTSLDSLTAQYRTFVAGVAVVRFLAA